MKKIKLYWVSKFQDLVASELNDKGVLSEYLKWAIKEEEGFNNRWKNNKSVE